ncbi:MAG: RNA-binding S4 domain-containing protein [Alistipes sp.]|nr:RNA-binding S4 domain-containing protein [Alistipes sp.]
MENSVRLDKWLWAVRIFKTRSDAAEACRANKVWVNDAYTKPSREVKVGDRITVKKMPVVYNYRVIALVSSRQPAKNVPEFAQNLTTDEELEKLHIPRLTLFVQRDRGTGRPTKRERREIDTLMDEVYDDSQEEPFEEE